MTFTVPCEEAAVLLDQDVVRESVRYGAVADAVAILLVLERLLVCLLGQPGFGQ
jgi:hypothetical protein